MSDDKPLAKVAFRDEDGDVETLWAFDLGGGLYQLDNAPWFQYGVSCGDTVAAEPEADDELPTFTAVFAKCGNRTVRISLEEKASEDLLAKIKELGCSYEGTNGKYFAITVPPHVDLSAVARFLTAENLLWEHADPTYEEIYGDADA